MEITCTCSNCGGDGKVNQNEVQVNCPVCEGKGTLVWGTIDDLQDKLDDIMDKLNDIWEKLNE